VPKPDELPEDHPVRTIPHEHVNGALDFIGKADTAEGYLRAYDEEDNLVWWYGPVGHLVLRYVATRLLDNADRLELLERDRKARQN
jgi:hypothetical protein